MPTNEQDHLMMRWRMADRITTFQPWDRIEGRKAISLEEYSLQEPLGREGEFPESLLVESCVQFSRWLMVASSSFTLTAQLAEVTQFEFSSIVRPGEMLTVDVTVTSHSAHAVTMQCNICSGGKRVCSGILGFTMTPLQEYQDSATLETLWKELRGQAEG